MAFGRRHKRRKTGVLFAIAAPTSRPLTRAHRDAVEDVVDDLVAEDGFDNDLATTTIHDEAFLLLHFWVWVFLFYF